MSPRSFGGHFLVFFSGNDVKYREPGLPAILRLFVLVCFYYAIGAALIMYWPAWQTGYQTYFRKLGDAAFEQFLIWPSASVHFLDLNSRNVINDIRAKAPPLTLPASFPVPHRDKVMDTLMLLKNTDPNRLGLGQFRTSSRVIGYWPLLTMLCFAAATPGSWRRRRLWVLFWSILIAHAFIVFRLVISLLQAGFADPKKSYRLFDVSPWWFEKLKRFDSVLNDNPTVGFIAPVILWLMIVVAMELWPLAWKKVRAAIGSSSQAREMRRQRRETIPDFRRPKR